MESFKSELAMSPTPKAQLVLPYNRYEITSVGLLTVRKITRALPLSGTEMSV